MPTVGFSQVFSDGQTVRVIGVILVYADGTTARISVPFPLNAANLLTLRDTWLTATATGVICMSCYFNREYPTWENRVLVRQQRYKVTLHGDNNYWYSPTVGFGSSMNGAPADALVKTGGSLSDATFALRLALGKNTHAF